MFDGTSYLIQAGRGASLKMLASTTAPDPDDPAHWIASNATWSVTIGSDSLYVWAVDEPGYVIVSNA